MLVCSGVLRIRHCKACYGCPLAVTNFLVGVSVTELITIQIILASAVRAIVGLFLDIVTCYVIPPMLVHVHVVCCACRPLCVKTTLKCWKRGIFCEPSTRTYKTISTQWRFSAFFHVECNMCSLFCSYTAGTGEFLKALISTVMSLPIRVLQSEPSLNRNFLFSSFHMHPHCLNVDLTWPS